MEACGEPVLHGRGHHLDCGLSNLGAFPILQRAFPAFPQPERPLPRQRSPRLYGTVAVGPTTASLHHLPPCLPVLPSPHAHHGLLSAHLPAPEDEEGHGGAQQECYQKEEQGLHEDQHHASRHSGGICYLLAPLECLQHGVWLEPRGHPNL